MSHASTAQVTLGHAVGKENRTITATREQRVGPRRARASQEGAGLIGTPS
jgi:hypothetical protein